MLLNNKPIPVKTKKEKEDAWQKLCLAYVDKAEAVYNLGEKLVANLMGMELDGGKCPKCSEPWVKVKFDNPFGAGEYYTPACYCFYSCPRCRKQLYLAQASGKLETANWMCTNCSFPLTQEAEEMVLKQYGESELGQVRRKIMQRYFDSFKR